MPHMNIVDATADYEKWLAKQVELNKADLALKHQQMAEALFPFMRATFYRWIQTWPEACPALSKAPLVLGVGDLHVDNFGTWRDIEGRLVWGVNDFDEAAMFPYTNDLVRLAASACIAIESSRLELHARSACAAILDGYSEWLRAGGRPYVLDESAPWLSEIAAMEVKDPIAFWSKLKALPSAANKIPDAAAALLSKSFPEPMPYRILRRTAGLGSLGLPRFVGLSDWNGGSIARQVKALVQSAHAWARGIPGNGIRYAEIHAGAIRSPDFTLKVEAGWVARRIAPDCKKIELATMPAKKDEVLFLKAMGGDTANVHLGSKRAIPAVLKDLAARTKGDPEWLANAAKSTIERLRADHREWKKHFGG